MATETDIVNLALQRLGLEAISSLSDTTNRAKVMNTFYDQVRKATLEEFNWPFALKRKKLQEAHGDSPDFGYSHAMELPCDYIRAVSEYNDYEYVREGEYILSDSSDIQLKYIADISDTTKFPPLFIKTLYLKLAVEASYNLIQDKDLVAKIESELEDRVFPRVRAYASQESTPQDYEITDFLDIRL